VALFLSLRARISCSVAGMYYLQATLHGLPLRGKGVAPAAASCGMLPANHLSKAQAARRRGCRMKRRRRAARMTARAARNATRGAATFAYGAHSRGGISQAGI